CACSPSCYIHVRPPHPHPFPTRRSSDLGRPGGRTAPGSRERFSGPVSRLRPAGGILPDRPGYGGRRRSGRMSFRASILIPLLSRSEEHTSELQSRVDLVCRLLLEKKKNY